VGWSLGQTTVQREGVDVPILAISQVISSRLKYGIGLSKPPSYKLMFLLTLLLLLSSSLKVKVEFFLEHATKAQRGIRGIALLFL
jgi:hypothetical protein